MHGEPGVLRQRRFHHGMLVGAVVVGDHVQRLCCVVGSGVRLAPFGLRSDGERQLLERGPGSVVG